jgi:predicted kinase
MAQLILMIGIPGSGKSSLAARLQQTCPGCLLISTDQIRARLFGDEAIQGSWCLIWQEIRQQFNDAIAHIQHDPESFALFDATNARRRNRRELIALARSIGFTQITGIWLDPPLEVCLERNQNRSRQVPEAVIQRMHRQLWSCPPRLREGIDQLFHYDTATSTLDNLLNTLAAIGICRSYSGLQIGGVQGGQELREQPTLKIADPSPASTEISAIPQQEPNPFTGDSW